MFKVGDSVTWFIFNNKGSREDLAGVIETVIPVGEVPDVAKYRSMLGRTKPVPRSETSYVVRMRRGCDGTRWLSESKLVRAAREVIVADKKRPKKICGHQSSTTPPYYCTLPHGHSGLHTAFVMDTPILRWSTKQRDWFGG